MALTTARISSARWRPPGLGGGIKSLIRSHSASVRSVGYGVAVIPPVYRTGATYGRLFKQPLRTRGERLFRETRFQEIFLRGCHGWKHPRTLGRIQSLENGRFRGASTRPTRYV